MQIEQTQMITFTIDGQPITVPKGTTVYSATVQLGIKIPIFCYQDRMPPFGACRVCLVEVDKMSKLQTSCTLEATEGMIVKTQTQMAVEGRKGILEFLLINHPLDCPICDRGGECPLQENALHFGPGESRFFEEKRHFLKPIGLGPVLMLDRERCIVCARCTRFGEIIAGDHALTLIDRGYKTEVGTPGGSPVESKFIGNTIMICPVGALTSQVYRFRARPWDNDSTESTCTLCPVGCSMILDSRDGEIMRTRSRENRDINDIWMCDKGWFGYEFVSHPDRLKQPLIRRGDQLEPASWDEALSLVAAKINESKPEGKIAAFGGNTLTIEENFLFQKLMREGVKANHIDHRIGMPIFTLDEEGIEPGMEMPIRESEDLSFAILAGIDLTEEFPVIWIRLKQALNRGAKVIFLGHYAPEISSQITKTILHVPGKELETLHQQLPLFSTIAEKGGKGAIFVGRQYLHNRHRKTVLSEFVKFQEKFSNVSINILEGKENSMGARLAGMHPALGPLGEKLSLTGLNAIEVLLEASRNRWGVLYVCGADPALKFSSQLWKKAREKLGFLVVQDLFLTETAKQADVVLPALCFVEKTGHFLNIEGRIQKLSPGKDIPKGVFSDADIFAMLAQKLNFSFTSDHHFSEIMKSGKLQLVKHKKKVENSSAVIENELLEDSFLATFAPALFDHGVRMKRNPHVIQLSKEAFVRLHPIDGVKQGIKNGDRIRLRCHENSISANVKLDERVAGGSIVLPIGFENIPVQDLAENFLNGFSVKVEKEL